MERDYDFRMRQKGFLPYQMGYLTDWMVKLAEDELKETEETRNQALLELRRIIAKHKELKVCTDDAYLLQFLRARKFDVKRAWELLHRFYVVKGDYPEIYPQEVELENMKKAHDQALGGGAYQYRDKNGSIIVFFTLGKWDPDQIPLSIALSAATCIILKCIEDPATQVCGVQLIIDAKNVSFKHVQALSPRYLQLIGKALRNVLPMRFTGVHIVNESVLFSYIFSIIKIFLSEKIKKRVHFHGSDMKHLHKYIPKEILPPDYEGDNTNYCPAEWANKEMYPFFEKYRELIRNGFR